MCAIFKCYFTCTFIHGQLLAHLYALLSCHAAPVVKCFINHEFLWQINDDDDDEISRGAPNYRTDLSHWAEVHHIVGTCGGDTAA